MRPAAPAREAVAVAATIAFIAASAAIDLRLRSGDERRQAIDAAVVRDHGLRLRLILRLRTVLAVAITPVAELARLLLVALIALIGLTLARLLALAVVAHVGLRLLLHRNEAGLLTET